MTRSGTVYKQRDILIIPIPFTYLTTNKRRPVVVLSNDYYNNRAEDIVVVAMTSNIEQKEYSILISNDRFQRRALSSTTIRNTIKLRYEYQAKFTPALRASAAKRVLGTRCLFNWPAYCAQAHHYTLAVRGEHPISSSIIYTTRSAFCAFRH